MNKRELGDAVAGAFGGNKAMGGAAVDAVTDAIAAALAKGEKISIAGFGNFEVRMRPARMGRNPRTGDPVGVQPKRLPFFKVGKELKERVNNGYLRQLADAGQSAQAPVAAGVPAQSNASSRA